MIDAWNELLEATRDFHAKAAHVVSGCRLCSALRAFPETPTLFDPPPPPFDPGALDRNEIGGFRATDPATSRKAALAAFPRSGTHRHRAFAVILAAGDRGATAAEVIEETDLPHQTISTRISELKSYGWVVPRGERPGNLGRPQEILVATEKARAASAAQLAAT